MPIILPAIAGFAATSFAAGGALGVGIAGFAGSLMGGLVIGAVTGAVVGGIQSAVMGGDIMEGVLYGAVGGAAGGALSGAFTGGAFGSLGGTTEGAYSVEAVYGGGAYSAESIGAGSAFETSTSGFASSGIQAGGAGGGTGLALSTTDKLLMAQGGMGLLEGFGDDEEGMSTEEQKDMMKFQTDEAIRLAQAKQSGTPANPALAVAQVQAAQSERESIRNAELAYEKLSTEDAQFSSQLAQREAEMLKPYEEEAAKRARILETAQGFAVTRQNDVASQSMNPGATIVDQTPVYSEVA